MVVLGIVAASYGWAIAALPAAQARAFAFTVLVVANIALIFANRSHTLTIVESLRQPNKIVWVVAGAAVCALAAALYVPLLADIFLFAAPPPGRLVTAAALGASSVLWFDLVKLVRRRLDQPEPATT
jgi:Ca2+-transporting ATPase